MVERIVCWPVFSASSLQSAVVVNVFVLVLHVQLPVQTGVPEGSLLTSCGLLTQKKISLSSVCLLSFVLFTLHF